MNEPTIKPLAMRIPAAGTSVLLIHLNIKQRNADDGGHGEFFDEIPDLEPWYGDAFPERRVSDFYLHYVDFIAYSILVLRLYPPTRHARNK